MIQNSLRGVACQENKGIPYYLQTSCTSGTAQWKITMQRIGGIHNGNSKGTLIFAHRISQMTAFSTARVEASKRVGYKTTRPLYTCPPPHPPRGTVARRIARARLYNVNSVS